MHPLKPRQSITVHIEGRNTQALLIRSQVIIKKLVDLEDPTHRIGTIKSGNIQLDGGGRSNGRTGRRKARR
ncbi:hypothetical protein L195_g062844, partial [Trifolium pratense]